MNSSHLSSNNFSAFDYECMAMAITLAKKAYGAVSPNPMVGAVIVKDQKIIGTGYHQGPGTLHAEADAINNANQNVSGGVLYCNLEPCCHLNKRTPPCAQAIIKSGIKKVVIAVLDPNPLVAGEGVKLLQEAGIEVTVGLMQNEATKLNEIFFTHITKQRPYIHLKWAQTFDGKVSGTKQEQRFITNDDVKDFVHWQRKGHDAILVGGQTIREDNPKLTIRVKNELEYAKKRIVFSKTLTINNDYHVFQDEFKDKTIVINVKNLKQTLKDLYQMGVMSLYVEGGPGIHALFLKEKLYDRISLFVAPRFYGKGKKAVLYDEKFCAEFSPDEICLLGDNIYMGSSSCEAILTKY